MEKILIIGATGKIGLELIKCFDQQEHLVKLFIRKQSESFCAKFEKVIGDLSDKESLRYAMLNVKCVFLLSAPTPDQVHLQKNLIDVAKEFGIKHIVRISAMGIQYDANNPFTMTSIAQWHNEIDSYLVDSGIAFTLINPNFFMQNLKEFKNTIQQESIFYATISPDAKISMVHIADIAYLAYQILTNLKLHLNKSYDITGPEALSFKDIAKQISAELNKQISYMQIGEQEYKTQLSKNGVPEWFIKDKLGFFRGYSAGYAEKIHCIQQIVTSKSTHFSTMLPSFK